MRLTTVYLIPYLRNTGFLRYWTFSNIPLFALAAPMLFVLIKSGIYVMRTPSLAVSSTSSTVASQGSSWRLLQHMALAQIVLAVLVATSYHVQIITRLSSGYPVWYWWLARSLLGGPQKVLGRRVLVFMVIYSLVQAALFGSFLPPA